MSHLRWFRRAVAGASVALCAMQMCSAQSLLSEPDFSGMYTPSGPLGTTYGSERGTVVARDSVRGWNYVVRSNYDDVRSLINGVQVGNLSRISDSGVLDLGWNASDVRTPQQVFVLANGDLLSFDGNWQRVRQNPGGNARVEPFQWTASGDCPGSFGNSVPAARDRAGNVYAFIHCFSVNAPATYGLRRVLSSGELDLNWRLDVATSPSQIIRLTVGDDGSVFYVTLVPEAPFSGVPTKTTLHRSSVRDSLRWSRDVVGGVAAIAADSLGRSYVLGNGTSASMVTLIRFDAAGQVDPAWTPAISAAALGDQPVLRVLGERLLVAADNARAGGKAGARLLSLADGGARASRDVPDGAVLVRVDDDGTLIESDSTGITLITPRREDFIEHRIAAVMGTIPTIAAITRWGDGYVLGGQFEYWHDGVRYANLMRLTAALKPDPTWQPRVTGSVYSVVIDRDGGMLVGGENLLGAQINLVRFAMNGQRDPRWSQRFDGAVMTLTAAASGVVHVGGRFNSIDGESRSSIARFQVDGSLDAGWAQRPPWCPQLASSVCLLSFTWVTKIIDSGAGGVLAFWRNAPPFSFDESQYLSRLPPAPDGASVPMSNALNAMDQRSIVQDPVTSQLYGAHTAIDPTTQRSVTRFVRLLPTTLEIDPFWTPLIGRPYVVGFSDTHMYLANGRRLTRLINAVADDPYWSVGRVGIAGAVPANTGERLLLWPTRGTPYAAHTVTQSIGLQTVVEYFASNVQRYFMTARPAEQQQLDALPSQFIRSGMHFTAFDGAVVAPASGLVVEASRPKPPFDPAGALPVCRFYASPQRGGSNTHFYGRGTDCQFLNTVVSVANEGYDFAALPTTNGRCPVNAPTPVYRLFNNQSAGNNGNHRYVVSQARLDEMKSRGWIDEGIAFCAIAGTDSRAVAQ